MAVTTLGPGAQTALRRTVWGFLTAPASAIGLGVLATVTIVLTYLTIYNQLPLAPTPPIVLTLVVVNFLLVLVLAAVVAVRLAGIWNQRRSGLSQSRLHARLVGIFAAIAIIPAVLTAAFAAFTINLGMEAWFSKGVKTALRNSLTVAQAYLDEHKRNIRNDITAMANDVNTAGPLALDQDPLRFNDFFRNQALFREIHGAFLYDGEGRIVASAPGLVLFADSPTREAFEKARSGEIVLETNSDSSHVRALLRLGAFADLYLLGVRRIDAKVIGYQEDTQLVVGEYNRLNASRTPVQITLGLAYASMALILLIASVFAGMWAASRIVAPISRLVVASERVSKGDLAARVPVDRSDDEVATLSMTFNRMTGELESQREALMESHRQTEIRRRFTEAVLSGVTAGVIGLDGKGHINILNRSAQAMLNLGRDVVIGTYVRDTAPEFQVLVQAAMDNIEGRAQGQVDIVRTGKVRNLTVRVTSEVPTEGERGYVVTFDDITDLINAQRSSAWADVARRIAHEIKNPLTPIQLSAERLRRKYKAEITTDPDVFEQCTQTIIRQVSDIGRMVDEFSSFARMPQPVMRMEDFGEVARHATFLQRVANPQIVYDLELPETPVTLVCDGRLVSQAFTNVLKNAGEAVKARFTREPGKEGEGEAVQDGGRIEIRILATGDTLSLEVCDNGIGLPKEDRHRLTEPYVTKRVKGTGLGLAIVNKIMEDHGGKITLDDAPLLDATGQERGTGARVLLTFPKDLKPASATEQTLTTGTGSDDEQKRATNAL